LKFSSPRDQDLGLEDYITGSRAVKSHKSRGLYNIVK